MIDTASATVEVLDITMLPGRRWLMGLAQIEVTLDGVAIILQGMRILRRADGLSYVEPPCYRLTDSDLVPAIVLPGELEDAVARAVLEQAFSNHRNHRLPNYVGGADRVLTRPKVERCRLCE